MMHIGIVTFVTEYTLPVTDLAIAAEERGFESLFVTEHTHIPASRETPYAGGIPLPDEYSHTLDPFVSLAAAAAVTSRLQLGTGICLVTEHDPIALAKAVASLDHLSAGRFLFGLGAGWNAEEMRNHGIDPRRKWEVATERVAAMQAIWTQDEATHHSADVSFDRIWSWPKPVQKPWPPILVGGAGRRTLERVLTYGNGWMPIYAQVHERLPAMFAELQHRAAELDRRPVPVTIYWAPSDRSELQRLAEMGASRVLFRVPVAERDPVLRKLDEYAALL